MIKTFSLVPFHKMTQIFPKYLHLGVRASFMNVRDPAVEKKSAEVTVVHETFFDKHNDKNKKAFFDALQLYITKNTVHRRGHVEFLYAALSRVELFKAHRNIETYRKLLEVFPKYKMIPQNVWQQEFMHYPKQQQCCIDILDFMESHGVTPDDDFGYQLLDLFGDNSHVFRKYRRMMYWMPKFKYANPYFIPYDLPDEMTKLAELILRRMSPDLRTNFTHFKTADLAGVREKTSIISAQSPDQQELLKALAGGSGQTKHVVVEGGFKAWARSACMTYFVLKTEGQKGRRVAEGVEEICEWKQSRDHEVPSLYTFNDQRRRSTSQVALSKSIHEQEDGTVLAMAITGSSSKDSLVSWIKCLEDTNPTLSSTPVLFQLTHNTQEAALQKVDTNRLPERKI